MAHHGRPKKPLCSIDETLSDPEESPGITTEDLLFVFFRNVQASDVFYPVQHPIQPDRVAAPIEDVVSAQLLHGTLKLRFAPGQRGRDIKIQVVTEETPVFGDFGGESLDLFSFFGLQREDLRREGRNTTPERSIPDEELDTRSPFHQ